VDFLFVLIELLSLGITGEALQANIDRKSPFQGGGAVSAKLRDRDISLVPFKRLLKTLWFV